MNELLICRRVDKGASPVHDKVFELIARIPIDKPRTGQRVFRAYLQENKLSSSDHSYFNFRIGAGFPSYIANPSNI